jgi:hypothetical protein
VEAVEFATLAGLIGSTTGGYWNRSDIDHSLKLK